MNYDEFLSKKQPVVAPCGLTEVPQLNQALYPFQRDIVTWTLKQGRAAIFADCGLGKTLMQLEWAHQIPGDVLILTPLAVAQQSANEAKRFGIDAAVSRDGKKAGKITLANYEKLHLFSAADFNGIVLDESSILKSYDGSTRTTIIESFARTPYRLACTATPAPNDHMELGNHAEFLGVMTRAEMLAMYFVHDGGETSVWRLKGHAEADFWKWVASWAVMIRKPSDLGYPDDGFKLPPMNIIEHHMKSGAQQKGVLFTQAAEGLDAQRKARRSTLDQRVHEVARLVNDSREPWLVWCELNDEGDALEEAIDDAEQVAGADSDDDKSSKMLAFSNGTGRVLVTKPSIAGFGMNWQHCRNMIFVGLSDSWEQYYQAIRRCWRYGQMETVNVYVVTADIEGMVVENIKRKDEQSDRMMDEMAAIAKDFFNDYTKASNELRAYQPKKTAPLPNFI